MANDKAPRLDGFPYDFYKKLWYMVGHDLHKVYLKAMHTGSLRSIINRGNIKFISKPRDPNIITNQRPITLLNVRYKIIVKAFALLIHHPIPLFVSPE